jgi:hypothetical protein
MNEGRELLNAAILHFNAKAAEIAHPHMVGHNKCLVWYDTVTDENGKVRRILPSFGSENKVGITFSIQYSLIPAYRTDNIPVPEMPTEENIRNNLYFRLSDKFTGGSIRVHQGRSNASGEFVYIAEFDENALVNSLNLNHNNQLMKRFGFEIVNGVFRRHFPPQITDALDEAFWLYGLKSLDHKRSEI